MPTAIRKQATAAKMVRKTFISIPFPCDWDRNLMYRNIILYFLSFFHGFFKFLQNSFFVGK